jgi:hypothetical protein
MFRPPREHYAPPSAGKTDALRSRTEHILNRRSNAVNTAIAAGVLAINIGCQAMKAPLGHVTGRTSAERVRVR